MRHATILFMTTAPSPTRFWARPSYYTPRRWRLGSTYCRQDRLPPQHRWLYQAPVSWEFTFYRAIFGPETDERFARHSGDCQPGFSGRRSSPATPVILRMKDSSAKAQVSPPQTRHTTRTNSRNTSGSNGRGLSLSRDSTLRIRSRRGLGGLFRCHTRLHRVGS